MMCKAKGYKFKCKAPLFLLLGGIAVLWQLTALATQSVTLGWEPSVDTNVVGYNIYYGTASHVYGNKVSVGNVTNATISGLVEGTTYFFAATTTDVSGAESDFSNEASYAVPLPAIAPPPVINQPPTLNALSNVNINENAPSQTVALSGITSGSPTEVQTLTVTASSSNPSLIPNPTVNYASPNQTGTLTFAPVTYASGTAVITVTVNDGGATNNLFNKTFTVTVAPVNQPPTLNPISNVSINENAPSQTVALSGITSGAPNEIQTLAVTAVSSNPSLIPNPTVKYTSPSQTGTLTFAPVANAAGTATITVTANDQGASNNIVVKTFNVTVVATPAPSLNAISNLTVKENAPTGIIALSGISTATPGQPLKITATSSNPALIPNPLVNYISPNNAGTLIYKPMPKAFGTATITITINGGQPSRTTTRTFVITVLSPFNPSTLVVNPPAPATLTQPVFANGQYAFSVSGTSGSKYVVQASTNLVDWVSVETNTAPFTFVDVNAAQFTHQFYRAVGQ